MKDKFYQNFSKPVGVSGKLVTVMMNHGAHAALASWGFKHLDIKNNAFALDVGCGGGANVKRLLEYCPLGHVTGVDYSEISVEKSANINAKAVESGLCDIVLADVAKLPFQDQTFDVVTAFETVYFWQEPLRCYKELFRIIKPEGLFMVCNESTGRDEMSLRCSKIINGMNLYTAQDIEELMKNVGFRDIKSYVDEELSYIAVIGRK